MPVFILSPRTLGVDSLTCWVHFPGWWQEVTHSDTICQLEPVQLPSLMQAPEPWHAPDLSCPLLRELDVAQPIVAKCQANQLRRATESCELHVPES